MNSRVLLACAAGLAILLPGGAQAAAEAGQWETDLGISFTNSTDADFKGGTTADFESDTGFRLGLGYHLSENLEIGASLGFGQRDYEADIAGDEVGEIFRVKGDIDYTSFVVNGTFNFMSGPFSPFVTGGIGWSWVDTNIASEPPQTGCWWDPWWGYVCTTFQETRTLDGLTYQVGVGARYDFSDQFALKASYRIDWIDFDQAEGTPDFDGFELSVGWKF